MKKKKPKKNFFKYSLIGLGLLVLIIVLYVLVSPVFFHWDCYSSGGKWTTFSNDCGDLCGPSEICGPAFTFGCNCGPNKCWDENNCVKNE